MPPWGKALSEFPTWRIKNFPLGGEKKKKKQWNPGPKFLLYPAGVATVKGKGGFMER